jgi:ABC-type transport system involved in multi-copper enzyme maturation permease subunit
VSRFLAVTGLALRELWISFRLLLMVGMLLLAALPTSLPTWLLPATAQDPLAAVTQRTQPFAIGLAAGLALAAGVAAGTLAAERRRGTAGWLVSRAVPRATIVVGWFAAFAVVLLIGMAPSAGLAWLALGSLAGVIDPVAYVVSVTAAAGVGLAALALGLLLGSLLDVLPAMLVSAALAAVALVPAAAIGLPALAIAPAPGAPLAVLADLADAARPIGDSVRAGGLALAGSAALLVFASAVMSRADL